MSHPPQGELSLPLIYQSLGCTRVLRRDRWRTSRPLLGVRILTDWVRGYLLAVPLLIEPGWIGWPPVRATVPLLSCCVRVFIVFFVFIASASSPFPHTRPRIREHRATLVVVATSYGISSLWLPRIHLRFVISTINSKISQKIAPIRFSDRSLDLVCFDWF